MIDNLLQLFVLSSIAIIAYHHAVYPALLAWLAKARAGSIMTMARSAETALPSITLIVPARNEAAVIAGKIENLVALDYPSDRLTVIIALDGCTDDTLLLAKEALKRSMPRFACELVAYPRNIGKVAVLNEQIGRSQSQIVALSDASAKIGLNVLKRAAMDFSDPTVGVVVPTYRLAAPGSTGEAVYVGYLTTVRRYEAVLWAPLGAHGALYFFRRDLWKPLPADTINDDFILPMEIVAQGYRGVYDPEAIVEEVEQTHARQDFRRRVRLGAGNAQQSIRLLKLAGMRKGWLGFMFLSGKGARPLMPMVAIAGICAVTLLAVRGVAAYQGLLVAIMLAIAGGLYAIWRGDRGSMLVVPMPFQLIGYMISGYAAALLGAARYIAGQRISGWQPLDAGAPVEPVEPERIWWSALAVRAEDQAVR